VLNTSVSERRQVCAAWFRVLNKGTALWSRKAVKLVLALAVLLPGFAVSPPAFAVVTGGLDSVQTQHLSAEGNHLYAVWGFSASDVFAVGASGTILRYDGSSWNSMSSGVSVRLWGVWGSSPSDIFAVGDSGTILHYDGSSWDAMNSGCTLDLIEVWGNSAADIFAVGMSGTILHSDGGSWSAMDSGTTASLSCIWGTSSSDVIATGADGTIIHYDGDSWNPMVSGSTSHLHGIWASSASDVFVVGEHGTILRYDGASWSAMDSATTDWYWLQAAWGSSSSDVFAVGQSSTIRHFDGSAWTAMDSGTTPGIWDVWGSSSSDVFAVGNLGTIIHYDGNSWSVLSGATEGIRVNSIIPFRANQGETLDVTITGSNLVGATEVDLGDGIAVNSYTVESATQIEANITIDMGASAGPRDVSVTTPEGVGTLAGGFTIRERPEEGGGLFDCGCGSDETRVPQGRLAFGLTLTGLCWGTGYYMARRVRTRAKR
jgi:hypothetical protein